MERLINYVNKEGTISLHIPIIYCMLFQAVVDGFIPTFVTDTFFHFETLAGFVARWAGLDQKWLETQKAWFLMLCLVIINFQEQIVHLAF